VSADADSAWWRRWLSGDHRQVSSGGALLTVVLGAALAAGALVGLAWVAGPAAVGRLLAAADWRWLAVAGGCVAASYAGYYLAYQEVLDAASGPSLERGRMLASVIAGFGMVGPRAGFALDRAVWRQHGLTDADARQRARTLAIVEYAVLAPAAFTCAIVLLLTQFRAKGGVVASWVIGVPAGTAVTVALLAVRRRLPQRGFAWVALHRGLDAIPAALRMMRSARSRVLAVLGMAIYWAADIAALGCCLTVVDHHAPAVDVLVVGYATGYALTRRSLPLAGAGTAAALMPISLHLMGLPLAAAVLAVFAYRLCNLWLPLAPAAVAMRHLRQRPRDTSRVLGDPR
jgi:uncharacterized membrane protein YbhN (UPF0104 family)